MAEEKKDKKEEGQDNGQDKKTKQDSSNTQTSEEKVAELEKKLGELGDSFNQYKEFTDGATLVINTIAGNPELANAFRQELKKRQGVVEEGEDDDKQQGQDKDKKNDNAVPSEEIKAVNQRMSGVETSRREEIIKSFESSYGIDKLKEEEKKEVRREIAGFFGNFGWKIDEMPIQVLASNLDKAYVATHAEKLREEGKLEGFTQAHANDLATMGTMSSDSLRSEGESKDLTPTQKEWAKKLGVDESKAKETYLNQDKEATTPSEAEKKASEKK